MQVTGIRRNVEYYLTVTIFNLFPDRLSRFSHWPLPGICNKPNESNQFDKPNQLRIVIEAKMAADGSTRAE